MLHIMLKDPETIKENCSYLFVQEFEGKNQEI